MTKQQRYRRKCLSDGRCPHCGEPCAPYYECEDRRRTKRIHRLFSRASAIGAITKIKKLNGGVTWKFDANAEKKRWPLEKASGRKGDRRVLPRLGDKPTRATSLILWLAKDIASRNGGLVTEDQVSRAFAAVRVRHSGRVKHG